MKGSASQNFFKVHASSSKLKTSKKTHRQ